MTKDSVFPQDDLFQLRLFLEELVCNICRFAHAEDYGIGPGDVRIRQEVALGPTAYVDNLIEVPGRTSYLVEMDYGYSLDRILDSIERKYSQPNELLASVSKLVVVVDKVPDAGGESLEERIESILSADWELEIWDEARILASLQDHFGIDVAELAPHTVRQLRQAMDRAKGAHAFGDAHRNEPLDSTLLWHFGYWRLRELYREHGEEKRAILSPKRYSNVAVLFADLTGFSGFVRDTPRSRTMRDCLEAFCAKSRYQIINDGGFLYQFLGDAVIGFFGIPAASPGDIARCFDSARSILMIADSISNEWQRQLDRVQPSGGAHAGMALGDLDLLSLRPFSRTHVGAVGDTINIAARLSNVATSGQIVASNGVYQGLPREARSLFAETPPVDAKNVGRIRAWTFDQAEHESPQHA